MVFLLRSRFNKKNLLFCFFVRKVAYSFLIFNSYRLKVISHQCVGNLSLDEKKNIVCRNLLFDL